MNLLNNLICSEKILYNDVATSNSTTDNQLTDEDFSSAKWKIVLNNQIVSITATFEELLRGLKRCIMRNRRLSTVYQERLVLFECLFAWAEEIVYTFKIIRYEFIFYFLLIFRIDSSLDEKVDYSVKLVFPDWLFNNITTSTSRILKHKK